MRHDVKFLAALVPMLVCALVGWKGGIDRLATWVRR